MIAALPLIAMAMGPVADCANLDRADQATLNFCEHERFRKADGALNATWKRVAAIMKQRDADIDRSYDRQPRHFDTLLGGQRAWLAFRDYHCQSESFLARGGSMQPMLLSGCKAAMTDERTKQLQSLIEQ